MPDHAETLRALHRTPPMLVLPNAWDAASARLIAAEGFPAIATTSAGVAAALGYPDGGVVPANEMIEAIARIARSVKVPVTADIEHAYGATPDAVADVVLQGDRRRRRRHQPRGLRAGRHRPRTAGAAAGQDQGHRQGVDQGGRARRDQRAHRRLSARLRRLRDAAGRGDRARQGLSRGGRRLRVRSRGPRCGHDRRAGQRHRRSAQRAGGRGVAVDSRSSKRSASPASASARDRCARRWRCCATSRAS